MKVPLPRSIFYTLFRDSCRKGSKKFIQLAENYFRQNYGLTDEDFLALEKRTVTIDELLSKVERGGELDVDRITQPIDKIKLERLSKLARAIAKLIEVLDQFPIPSPFINFLGNKFPLINITLAKFIIQWKDIIGAAPLFGAGAALILLDPELSARLLNGSNPYTYAEPDSNALMDKIIREVEDIELRSSSNGLTLWWSNPENSPITDLQCPDTPSGEQGKFLRKMLAMDDTD